MCNHENKVRSGHHNGFVAFGQLCAQVPSACVDTKTL